MTTLEKNIEIAKLLNIIIEQPYPENKDFHQYEYLFKLSNDLAKSLNELYNTTTILKFDIDYNWQFKVIDFIENLGYAVEVTQEDCIIFTNEQPTNELIISENYKSKKEAIFDTLYKFSQYYENLPK